MSDAQLSKVKKASFWDKEEMLKGMAPAEASALIWKGVRDGVWGEFRQHSGKMREEHSLALKFPEAATLDDWIRLLNILSQDDTGHFVREWSDKADDALRLALALDRDGLLARVGELRGELPRQLEAVRMADGEPDAVSDATLDVLAQAYARESSIYEGHWLHQHRDAFPKQRLARALVRQLDEDRAIHAWSLVEDVLEHLTDAEKVAVIVRYRGNDRRSKALEIVSAIPDAKALTASELERSRAIPDVNDSLRNAAYLLAQLHVADDEPVPESIDADLGYFTVQDEDFALDRQLFEALPSKRAAAIAGRSIWGNRRLLAAIDDEALLDKAVAELERASNNQVADAIGAVGERALGALARGAGEKKVSAKRAAGIAHALSHIATPRSAELLVGLLGNSSKVVRDVTQQSLGKLGAVAKPALDAGAKAKKKAVREASEELLSLLDAAKAVSGSPLGELQAELDALSVTEKAAAQQMPDQSHGWEGHIVKVTQQHGPVAALLFRDWFASLVQKGGYGRYAPATYFKVVDHYSGFTHNTSWDTKDPKEPELALAAAYGCLDAVARLPKMRKYHVNDVAKETRKHFGKWASPAAAAALRLHKTTFAEPLYEIAALDPTVSRDVLIEGLSESSKGIRTVSVQGLSALGAEIASEVTPLLGTRKKDAREAAAKVLAAVGAPDARDALAAALEKEKSDDVRVALEDALRAAGGSPIGPAGVEATPAADKAAAAWEAELTAGKKARLPKWADVSQLPELSFVTGEVLGEDARVALVGRLKKEHERPDPLVASLRPALDDASGAAFGIALYEMWRTAGKGKSADKWALYQLGQLGSDEWVASTGGSLDGMSSSGRHALAGWHLDVYERHGSPVALDWIGHWADHALTDGLQRKSIAKLKEIAAAQGITEAELRGRLNPFVADEYAETKVSSHGFDARGEQRVGYGARKFTIRLGADGGLRVVDDGKELKALPAARKDDDKDEVSAAKASFTRLKSSVGRTLKSVVGRFERAMTSGRTWERARFDAVFLEHPLMSTVATGLVFATDGGATFRVSEERTLLDSTGDDATVPADAVVRIVHPLELDAETLGAWRQHLDDADVVQPFSQVHRPTFSSAGGLEISKQPIKPGAFVGRVRDAGWSRGRPEDAGWVYYDWIRMPARGVNIQLNHSGYIVSDAGWGEDIKIDSIGFSSLTGQHLSDDQVDPIAFSEAQLAVQRLFGGAKPKPAPAAAAPAAAKPDGGTAQKALAKMGAGFPSADLAKSSRAKCMHCDEKMTKGEVRIVIEREISTPHFTGKGPGYMHAPCAQKWAEENGLGVDDFIGEVHKNTALKTAELPEPFGG